MKKETELLSKAELAQVQGAFGVEDVIVYGLNIQGVSNCCNTTHTGGQTSTDNGQTTKPIDGTKSDNTDKAIRICNDRIVLTNLRSSL